MQDRRRWRAAAPPPMPPPAPTWQAFLDGSHESECRARAGSVTVNMFS